MVYQDTGQVRMDTREEECHYYFYVDGSEEGMLK